MRRFSEDGSKGADEVRLGYMRNRCHGADVERLGVSAIHGVAGAQQAPVQVLDVPTHGATLRHQSASGRRPNSKSTDKRSEPRGFSMVSEPGSWFSSRRRPCGAWVWGSTAIASSAAGLAATM